MDWVTAILCGVQDQKNIKIAIIKAEIATYEFKLHFEEMAEKKGDFSSAGTIRMCLTIWRDQLKKLEE